VLRHLFRFVDPAGGSAGLGNPCKDLGAITDVAASASTASTVPSNLALAAARLGSPAPRARNAKVYFVYPEADWGPSFVVFVAQLEPTAVESEATMAKFTSEPEAAMAKSTSEPEAAMAKFTSEPEAAVAKSTSEREAAVAKSTSEPEAAVAKSTSEPEAPAEAASAKAPAEAASAKAPAEAASAKADHVNVGPTSAVTPTSAGNGRRTSTSAGNGRRTQRRAGCDKRRGGQADYYLAHHDAYSMCSELHPSLYEPIPRFPLSCEGASVSLGVPASESQPQRSKWRCSPRNVAYDGTIHDYVILNSKRCPKHLGRSSRCFGSRPRLSPVRYFHVRFL
jgi:hypothetical protein